MLYFYDDERLCVFSCASKKPVALYIDESDFWHDVNNKFHALPLFNKEAWYKINSN